MNFADLGLSVPILDAVTEQGYDIPTPIQVQAIPAIFQGQDVMAAAQTGTGKTAAFTLPLLENLSYGQPVNANQVRALILTPTRELAAQIEESIRNYGKNLPLRSMVVFGGVKINPQMIRLRKGVDILVATPGRLLDLANQNAVRFSQLEVLVLDEADRMLDMGFIHDIRRILVKLPKKRQNLLFSATFSDEIRQLAKTIVHNSVEISVSPRNTAAETVKQWLCPVDKKHKGSLLIKLIKEHDWRQVLVFTRTKRGANQLTRHLEEASIHAAAIHGNKSQGARTKALAEFKTGKIRILVATDIAARGLDIDQLPQVVNFDLPNVAEDYVHRIGRTGRAGSDGQAVSLVSADEFDSLVGIERLIKQIIPREFVDGFEPVHSLPESRLDRKIIRAKKLKKSRERRVNGQYLGTNMVVGSKGKSGNNGRSRFSGQG
jgi:ATP-dependent RNA helicase RhlE